MKIESLINIARIKIESQNKSPNIEGTISLRRSPYKTGNKNVRILIFNLSLLVLKRVTKIAKHVPNMGAKTKAEIHTIKNFISILC